MSSIKPCPFCSHNRPRLLSKRGGKYGIKYRNVYVQCPKCSAGGPYDQDETKAIELWNNVPRNKLDWEMLYREQRKRNLLEQKENDRERIS